MKKLLTALALALCCMAGSFAYEAYVVGTDLHFTNVESVKMTTVMCESYDHYPEHTSDKNQYYIHWDIRLSDGTKWEVENGAVATNAPIEHDDGTIRKLIKDSKKKK